MWLLRYTNVSSTVLGTASPSQRVVAAVMVMMMMDGRLVGCSLHDAVSDDGDRFSRGAQAMWAEVWYSTTVMCGVGGKGSESRVQREMEVPRSGAPPTGSDLG